MMPKYKPPRKARPPVRYTADLIDDNTVLIEGSDGYRLYMNVATYQQLREGNP